MSVLFNSHIFASLQNSCSRYRCLNRSMAVREQTLHDLNLLNLVTYFMAYHMVSFGKCPIILEKNVYFCYWVKYSTDVRFSRFSVAKELLCPC